MTGLAVRVFCHDVAPGWTRDGRVLFTTCSAASSHCRLEAIDRDGQRRATLGPLPRFTLDARLSPDARLLLFTRTDPPTGSSSVVRRLGGTRTRILARGGDARWSRDGRQVAFVSDRDRHGRCLFHNCTGFAPELYVADATDHTSAA